MSLPETKSRLSKLLFLFDRHEKVLILRLLALMIIGALLETATVGAVPAFVALLSNPDLIVRRQPVAGLINTLGLDASSDAFILAASATLVGLFLIKNTYLTGMTYVNARFIAERQVSLSKRMFDAYMHAPYTFHLQHNSAELLRNVKGEVNEVVLRVLVPGLSLCMDTLMILFIFSLLLVLEPIISVVAFVVLGGVSLLFLAVIRKKLRHFGLLRHRLRMDLIQYFKQGLGGLKEARILGREDYFVSEYVETAHAYATATRYHRVITSLPTRVIETIAVGGLMLVALVMMARDTEMTLFVPMLVLFAVAAMRLMPSFKRVVSSVTEIRYHQPALDTVHDDLSRLERPRRADGPKPASRAVVPFRSTISLHDLHYTYSGAAAPALEGVTLSIPRGAAVAFVGTSGAGKTTLANSLLGLLEPTSGRICMDGRDIRCDLTAWQRHIGFIPQVLFLTDDSIRRNIAFGIRDDEIDDRRLETVVEAAQLESLVASLPRGLHTSVGEEGVRLSGGQRQRIAIARALYHDPDILVMDEATSALDNETERSVIRALERLRGNRTLIMIAHRLSTVRNCDRLFVLSRGRLVAEGSYDDLLAESSEFRTIAAA